MSRRVAFIPVIPPESLCELDETLHAIDGSRITPVFQPIVDLRHGVATAFEVLPRDPVPYRSPELQLDHAREIGTIWELERARRNAALGVMATLPPSARSAYTYFLNVSPDLFDDRGSMGAALDEYGLSRTNIVIEITERASLRGHSRFQELVCQYAEQGFQIALDDFGSGNCGLGTLMSCRPQYLKLDRAVTRDVDREPYKERIVRSAVALGQTIGAMLVAEGVETWGEVETLMGCGVEWAQGSLLGRPAPQPEALQVSVSRSLSRVGIARERSRNKVWSRIMDQAGLDEEGKCQSPRPIDSLPVRCHRTAMIVAETIS